jgi:YidC/Oxa1 family membrane protein insertase
METYQIHVLSNTHWDREWYMPHEKYLVRLVSLMDRLMDILKKNPTYIFITDGQFSMVDDYLQNRPERAEELKGYVKEGRLRVGPWFTQPLETLVSGEAMIRNLHYGIKGSEALGGAMRFSYEVDEFGHASQTPQVLKGFGIDGAIAWRGVPKDCRSAFEWVSPDGTSVVMLNTNNGYGEATALPLADEDFDEVIDGVTIHRAGLERRIKSMLNLRIPRSDSSHLMWLNGIDHSFAQPDLLAVLEKINEKYPNQEDALKKQQETMQLYSEYGVSPMGGCLPMLIQMPVFMALFFFVPNAIELRQQSFLWAPDLSAYDDILHWNFNIPFLGDHLSLFCLLFSVTNILNTWYTMKQQDTGQQQMPGMKIMMYLMPVMFIFIFNNYSSGLNYYYFISGLISILIMIVLRKTTNEPKLLAILEANKAKIKQQRNGGKGAQGGLMAKLEALQKEQERLQKERMNKK